MKKKVWAYIGFVAIVVLLIAIGLLYKYNYIPHRKLSNEDFGIKTYVSEHDLDGDGLDDQSDILLAAKAYVATNPQYKSQYYQTGYPNDEYGVCTDVVAFAMLDAGYDLMALVQEDIAENRDGYAIEKPDPKIDFRRVRNLKVFFAHTAQALSIDPEEIEEWQGGDIVVWDRHVGMISDARNRKGIPFVIHNGHPGQASYEEDILETYGEIIGHYRIVPINK